MAKKQPSYRAWRDSVKSISPIAVVEKLTQKADIVLIHGKKDDVVPFKIIEGYNKKLKAYNIKTKLVTIENAGHEIFLSDTVLTILKNSLNTKTN